MNKLITHKHVMGECPNLGPKVVLTNRKSRLTVRKKTTNAGYLPATCYSK